MNKRHTAKMLLLALLLCCAPASHAQLVFSYRFSEINQSIPSGGELLNEQTITLGVSSISDVKVSLNITGVNGNGFNGDLYANIANDHGMAVLLNRVGRDTERPAGYSDSGLNVTFSDGGSGDIHNYRSELSGNHNTALNTPLTGVWQPDARNVDPREVTASSDRTAFLNSFAGNSADGDWTLFVAEYSTGSEHELSDWGLEITSTPQAGDVLNFNDATISASSAMVVDNEIVLEGTARLSGAENAVFAGNISGEGKLIVQSGEGTWTLSGNNTFSGGVDVEGGTLSVKNAAGSATGSGTVTVSAGGTLTGDGTISGEVFIGEGGSVAPGSSPGTLSTGSVTFEAGGSYLWEINDGTGTAGNNPGWDLLSIDGSLTITATAENPFSIQLTTLTLDGTAGLMENFDPDQAYLWTIATASDGITGFDPLLFDLDTSGFLNGVGSGQFGISVDGGNVNLTFTPVPEPSTYALVFGAGLIGCAILRRCRKQS